jgi:multiple sugar transport system permease protein
VRALVVLAIALIMLVPLYVMIITAFKTRGDVVASPPLIVFKPTLEGFVFLFTDRAVVSS